MTTTHISKRLYTILFVLALIFAGNIPAYAQKEDKGKKNAEMIKELQEFKIKYLIQEAEITKEQQPEFVKLYTEMSNAKLSLQRGYMENYRALKDKSEPTDDDYNKVSEEMAGGKSAEGAIDQKYYRQFKRLLSAKQLFKLKEAEVNFNRKMMKMRDKKK